MKTMKEIKAKNDGDLQKVLKETREKLRVSRFDFTGAAKMKTHELRNAKQMVASILTELTSRGKKGNS